MRVVLIDKNGNTDGVGFALAQKLNVNMPIMFVSRVQNYTFNESVLQLANKPYCLMNYSELGWDHDFSKGGHYWGLNTQEFDFMRGDEWKKLDDFISNNPPRISFIRDLLKKDVTENVLPIVYPCFLSAEPLQTKGEFDNRIFQTIFSWGLSHEYRKELHGRIWIESGKHGYSVCDNLYYINGFVQNESNSKKWLTLNIPHYSRLPMESFIKINGLAKISISIAGAGRSCFRHAESPVNSTMLMWEDDIAWPKGMEWIHSYNCIKCKQGEEIKTILTYLDDPFLYDVYKNGVGNVDKYRFEKFIPYLENIINNA